MILIDLGYHKGEGLKKILDEEDLHFTQVIALEPIYHEIVWVPEIPFTLFPYAIDSESGYRTIAHHRDATKACTIERSNMAFRRCNRYLTVFAISPQELAQSISADEVCIKIDIEGSEYSIFKDLISQFANIRKIWMEPHKGNVDLGYDMNPDWPEWEELIKPATDRGIEVVKWD